MTLRHLQIFQAVAEAENFTKAAERLYITQSAVSHAVRELEEEAGTPLFDRLSKSVKITKSGQLLWNEVLPILAAFHNLESHMGALERQAPVHIVSCITIAAFWLPKFLQDFYSKWPDLSVHVEVVAAASAIEVLRLGKADLALIEGTKPQGPFREIPFASYSLKAVASPGYRAAGKELDLEAFCGERLLLREKGSAIRDTLDSALLLKGYRAYPVWDSVNSLAIIQAAKAGLGIAVLPEHLVAEELRKKQLVLVTIEGLTLKNQMIALWHQDKYLTEPLKTMIGYIEKDAGNSCPKPV